jgi:hypothetical protein
MRSLGPGRESGAFSIAGIGADVQPNKQERPVEADLGPVRYLATLLGSTDEQTIRAFILVVALLLDPAAVLLLLTANAQANHCREGSFTGRAIPRPLGQ